MEILRFGEIIGQGLAVGILKRAAAAERVPHAYLFSGMPGVGKTATARAFALYLNCEGSREGEACGACRSCRKMRSENFPDFKEISPEKGVLRIETVRELIKEFQYPPLEGRFRFTVVREAEKMTVEAANAFLKTLEEPPSGNILIMTASEPMGLLPTVVSRCRKVPFKPVDKEVIAGWLAGRGLALSDPETRAVAALSMGSPGTALRMIKSGFMSKRAEWIRKALEIPSMDYGGLLDLAEEMAGLAKKQLLDPSDGGDSALSDMLAFLACWFRDLLVLKSNEELVINIDALEGLRRGSEAFTESSLLDIIYNFHAAASELSLNRNARLVAQEALMLVKDRAYKKEREGYAL